MKKIKSLALIAMIIVIMTATVSGIWAHSFADVDEFDVSINTLSSLGVIRGKSATVFSPDDNVTRWQMALMITKLSTGITDDEIWRENSGDFPFTDVKEHHYRSSVAYAAQNGIIIGTSDTLFSPDQSITLQDGYTMACRILDYSGEKMDEGYPESYIEKAEQLGLSAGLDGLDYTAPLNRTQSAQLIFNLFMAKTADGELMSEISFGYTPARLVLAATSQRRISDSLRYTKSGKIALCYLLQNGTLSSDVLVCDESVLNLDALTDAALNSLVGKSWDVMQNSEGHILCAFECASAEIDAFEADSSIIINGEKYKPVESYSYDLKDGKSPKNNEIIIYGFGGRYRAGQILTGDDLAVNNEYFSLKCYDDNGDGKADRAAYIPYSFGRISTVGSIIRIDGEGSLELKTSKTSVRGTVPTSPTYALYCYDSEARELNIVKEFPLQSGYVTHAEEGYLYISKDIAGEGVKYAIGTKSLPNAKADTVIAALPENYTEEEGYSVEFVADDEKMCILALTVKDYTSSQSYVQGSGYVSSSNCAVVTDAPKTELLDFGYLELDVINAKGIERALIVKSVNNASYAVGDIVEYEYVGVVDIENVGETVVYSVSSITSRPYVVLSQSKAYTYHIGCSGNRFGLGKRASGQTYIEYDGQAIIGPDTRVLSFDGNAVRDITSSVLKNGFERTVSAGYCMYLSVNGENGHAELIYLREKGAMSSGANSADFTTVAYLSEISIKDENVKYSDGVYIYPHAVDLISGKTVLAYAPIDVSNGNYIQSSGCFAAYVDDEGNLCLLGGEPFDKNTSNDSASYIKRAVVTAFEHDESGLICITANGKVYKTPKVEIYELNQSRELVDYYNISLLLGGNYLVNGNYCIADIVISATEDGVAESITVIIHII